LRLGAEGQGGHQVRQGFAQQPAGVGKKVPGGRRHASRSNPKARRREPEEFRPGTPESGAKDSAEACASAEKVREAAAAKRTAEFKQTRNRRVSCEFHRRALRRQKRGL